MLIANLFFNQSGYLNLKHLNSKENSLAFEINAISATLFRYFKTSKLKQIIKTYFWHNVKLKETLKIKVGE